MLMQNRSTQWHFWSACLGNFFEHYDTALFGFLSVFLAPLFFPQHDEITALILTYAMIPLGMLSRPLGALLFGFIGDKYGTRHALFLSLCGMSIVTGALAFCPTYQQAGFIAPVIFCIGRTLQNFLTAGETMGGAIFLLESYDQKHHDFLSGLYNATTIGGILLASAGVSLLAYLDVVEWGWRVLYLLGCSTGVFGCIIRQSLPGNQLKNPSVKKAQSLSNLFSIFWVHRNALVLIGISSGFAYANYAVAIILMNGFVPLVSSITKAQMMTLNTILLILDFCALPFFGWLSSKISREKMMLGASIGSVAFGIPAFLLLPQASFAGIVGIRIALVLLGVAFFAPFHAWAQNLVPPTHRYGVISFGYALGAQCLGAPTAMLSLWAFKATGMASSVIWYWLLLAMISSVALILSMRPQADKKLNIIKEII